MPSARTEITEILTGVAMLGYPRIEDALTARPSEVRNVSRHHWECLESWFLEGRHAAEFERAWSNGAAFLEADAGLRGRRPALVEWKGMHRTPGYDLVPVDLRVDHVYLVSCKYLSRILFNAAPEHLFERLLAGRRRGARADWYAVVAERQYDALYARVRRMIGTGLPVRVEALDAADRTELKAALAGTWPQELEGPYADFCAAVAEESARRWRAGLADLGAQEEMLWRLLRLSGAPYFVLGASSSGVIRVRIYTPWDWRQEFALAGFWVWADPAAGQPVVKWRAEVRRRDGRAEASVDGHVEIRWSHGRFGGHPEAKVYLDTPHELVPGYSPLVPGELPARAEQLGLRL